MSTHKQIHLAAHFPGVNNTTVWSDPAAGSHIEFASFVHFARTAERGKFDFLFLAEGLRLREQNGLIYDLDVVGRPDTFTVLAALAAVTDRLGLDRHDQLDLQRALRGGPPVRHPRPPLRRAGRPGTSSPRWDAFTGENFRRGGFLPQDERYDRARGVPRRRPASCSTPGAATRSSPTRTSGTFLADADAGPFAAPRRAVRHRGPVQRAPQPAGPPGDLPGRRLRGGPRVRRRRRRRDLHPARHAGGGPGVLRRRQGPPRHATAAAPTTCKILPGGDVRARRHRRRGARERPTTSAASRSAAQTAIKFARAGVEPRPVRPTTPTARCPTIDPDRRREHDLQGPGQRPDVPRPAGDRARVAGAGRGRRTCRIRELVIEVDRPAVVRRHPGHGRRDDRRASCRPTPATASSSSRTSPRAGSTTSPTRSSRCCRSAASSAPSTRARRCATTSGLRAARLTVRPPRYTATVSGAPLPTWSCSRAQPQPGAQRRRARRPCGTRRGAAARAPRRRRSRAGRPAASRAAAGPRRDPRSTATRAGRPARRASRPGRPSPARRRVRPRCRRPPAAAARSGRRPPRRRGPRRAPPRRLWRRAA